MGNFIFGYGIDDLSETLTAKCTASSADSLYELDNLHDLNHLRRSFRFTVATTSTLIYNFGAAQTLVGLMLNDVNFTTVNVYRSTNGSSWTKIVDAATISKDTTVMRYKIYMPLTTFSYQYLKVEIPTQTPVDSLSVFRIGTCIPIPSAIELDQNPNFGYQYRGVQPQPKVVEFPTGSKEKVSMGSILRYVGSMSSNPLLRSSEYQWHTINAFDPTEHLVLYENFDNTSKCYLVQRNDNISVTWTSPRAVDVAQIEFEECI